MILESGGGGKRRLRILEGGGKLYLSSMKKRQGSA